MINTDRLCPNCMNENGGEKICPICGFDSSKRNPQGCLPIGYRPNNKYFLGVARSANGEGITYSGWDSSDDSSVMIREYFPAKVASRNPDLTVAVDENSKYLYNEGLIEFMEINRKLSGMSLPAVPTVKSVFEENGTVYAVYNNVASITLEEFLKKNGGTLKWEQARPLFLPLIDTVKNMNDEGYVHGGISPETISVGRDGKLRLTGYGIKKLRIDGDEITPELFAGYSAFEQYDKTRLNIGEFTDVYGLSAVLFRVLIGSAPATATERINNESISIPSKYAEELPRHVLQALANGLQVNFENRTKDIEIFKNELVYAETEVYGNADNPDGKKDKKKSNVQKRGGTVKYVFVSSVCTAAVFFLIIGILAMTVFKDNIFGKDKSQTSSVSSVAPPSVDKLGTVDSDAAESVKLYSVPDLSGKYYSEIIDNEDYSRFKFEIKTKDYSDKYAKGQIISQSVAAGTEVVKETTVEVTISLGPKEIKIANLSGLDEINAKLELLKQGFLYDNIQVLEKYDEDRKPGTVLEQEPKYGSKVSAETAVKIYINSYKEEEKTDNSSSE